MCSNLPYAGSCDTHPIYDPLAISEESAKPHPVCQDSVFFILRQWDLLFCPFLTSSRGQVVLFNLSLSDEGQWDMTLFTACMHYLTAHHLCNIIVVSLQVGAYHLLGRSAPLVHKWGRNIIHYSSRSVCNQEVVIVQ